MITSIIEYKKILESKNDFTDLIICDVQEIFKKFFNNTYLIKLRDYCEDFQRVHQIWDSIDSDDSSYYFPNQVNEFEKQYGSDLLEDDIEHYFNDPQTIELLYSKFANGFDAQDKFETITGDYWIYIGGKHEWFYCEKELAMFFKQLAEHKRKVCIVGGAEGECIYDIYETAQSFGINIEYNMEFVYSYNGSRIQENDPSIELDEYLREIEIEKENESIDILEEIPEDMYIDSIVDIFTDIEELKESMGDRLNSTNLTHKQVDRNDVIWITCYLKPRNNSTAYPLGEMGVIKCKVLETFYGLNKLKQLKMTDKIL